MCEYMRTPATKNVRLFNAISEGLKPVHNSIIGTPWTRFGNALKVAQNSMYMCLRRSGWYKCAVM